MILNTTSDIFRVRLSSAHTTNALDWLTSAKILTVSTGALGGLTRKAWATNGTTNVTIVDAPSSGQHIEINTLAVFNRDTITHTVTVEFYDGTTARVVKQITLQAGQSFQYTFQSGRWNCYSVDGQPIGDTGENGADGSDGADGALTVTEVEIDFGSVPVRDKQFTITDAGVSSTSKIIAVQSGKAATDRDADENAMDALVLNCKPESGQFVINAFAISGPVTGKYKVNYQFS